MSTSVEMVSKVYVPDLPRVENRTGVIHSVYASAAGEGSLHDFYTLCHLLIQGDTGDPKNRWLETTKPPTCGNCRRSRYWKDGDPPWWRTVGDYNPFANMGL